MTQRSNWWIRLTAPVLVFFGVGLGAREQPPVDFVEHLIADQYGYAFGIAAADLDDDGDLDLTSADATGNQFYWFENDGRGGFQRHFIQPDEPGWFERHAVGDIDRDGRPDVVVVKNLDGDLVWFRNSLPEGKNKPWQRFVITQGGLPGAYDVALADYDCDGDLDVAASSWTKGNLFAWFENPGQPDGGVWPRHLIDEKLAETRTVRAADMDGDGDMDLVGTATGANLVAWYENSGRPASEPWRRHSIDDRSARPVHGHPVDMDADGDLDVVMAHGAFAAADGNSRRFVWYENGGWPDGQPWTMHVIAAGFDHASEAVAADLDGDGDVDVAGTVWGPEGRLLWFENPGDPRGRWTPHILKQPWVRAAQVIIADLDGDGWPDIAAVAERGSNEFRWWRNSTRAGR